MTKATKTDRRVRRTRALLINSLISLLEEKSFKDITVKDLCDAADINRGTFYLHYRDIYDMIEQIEQDIMNQFEALISQHSPEELSEDPYSLIYDIFQFTAENADLCKTLLSQNGDISFLVRIKNLFRERFIQIWISSLEETNHSQLEYSYNFIAAGYVGLIESWLFAGRPESLEEMATLANNIITTGIRSLT